MAKRSRCSAWPGVVTGVAPGTVVVVVVVVVVVDVVDEVEVVLVVVFPACGLVVVVAGGSVDLVGAVVAVGGGRTVKVATAVS
jgi:hypothetical protein